MAGKSASLTFRLDPILKDKLSGLAKAQNRSIGNLTETLIREAVTAREKGAGGIKKQQDL